MHVTWLFLLSVSYTIWSYLGLGGMRVMGGALEHMVQLPKVPMVWYLELGILRGYDLLGRS